MDDKKIDELINKALQEDLALPEGLSERLERQIDFLAQEEISPRVSRRRSFYWISACSFASNTVLLLTKCKQCFRFKDNKIRNPRALHVFFASIYLHKNTFEA